MPDRPAGPMKVWTNRVPIDLVERWKQRARDEGAESSAMLRDGMEALLASTRRISSPPAGESAPGDCAHPRSERRRLGYCTICGSCGVAL